MGFCIKANSEYFSILILQDCILFACCTLQSLSRLLIKHHPLSKDDSCVFKSKI